MGVELERRCLKVVHGWRVVNYGVEKVWLGIQEDSEKGSPSCTVEARG